MNQRWGCLAATAMAGCWGNVIVRDANNHEFPESEAPCALRGAIEQRFYDPLASYGRAQLPDAWKSEARVSLVDASRHEPATFPGPRGAEISIDPRGELGEVEVRYWTTNRARGSMGTEWFPRTEVVDTECVHVVRELGEVTLVLERRSWMSRSEMMSRR